MRTSGEWPRDADRFRGALLGLAAGDAVGTSVEFRAQGSFPPVTDMIGGGAFRLPPGAWTDDTSMALCLAESLIERSGFDPVDQLDRYLRWYRDGHLSSTGSCFDIGNATRAAFHRFERRPEPFPGDADPDAAGNGPIMRLAPVLLAYALHPELAIRLAGESARTTHGAPQAVDACRYLAALMLGALEGRGRDDLLGEVVEPVPGHWDREPLHPEVRAVAEGSFRRKEPPAIQGAGYVVTALEAALWSIYTTRDFRGAVLAAANLGDDADTTAAICGQLAGAIYGVDAIPAPWLERLVMRDEIAGFADALRELSRRVVPPNGPVLRRPATPDSRSLDTPGDSYWVIGGRLLAGPYPGAKTKREGAQKLEDLLEAGVTFFVDLTEEGEGPPPLEPYAELLGRIAKEHRRGVTHIRLPIRDVDVPDRTEMQTILATIRGALDAGEVVYVHCWGGVGRTGTVVGCLLVEDGVAPDAVLEQIADLRRHTERRHRTSPETTRQRDFVRTWSPNPR